ncbi:MULTISPECIES: uroporphyrinogen-III C-methyltransferase [Serratia]|jgi:uroporphyrin-3 C-methyltransferase|uniref:uroporphyrinogen-III C-methyltransferase n=1 Tax=Serratia TaxID=613 RepID=UPI00035837E8|nr:MULTISPECIES: uroporphyrinogen-III C-methyltransferase [Serratia]AGQ29006.1 uroporphyrinogen III C-methyltransferase [Serratia liquefaciens ATCC 27592]PVD40635.1 uroporphyrinogen-III C-methyltransferase [Serratia liquefaciens]QHT49067.1 uroporphyrinogen-III C-methyltransferase [Serratia liquefaciens]CAI1085508.1 Putative uroporphyrinogen-III C-methyltransferase [Serratia liquefaciens]CAI1139760.1 Putative uroporphyrinogen-III C-methyltransferase [Serratia liquefaciens]
MTEQNTPSAPVEEPTSAVESPQQPDAEKRKGKNTGPVLGAIAIVLVIALAAGGYYHTHRQAQQLIAANQTLQQQLEALKQNQQQERSALEGLLQQQGKTLDAADREQATLARQLNELQEKVAIISGSDAKTWLLAQADFLVKMAGRKLWSDQDVTTAAALLKSADASLADMNDPSLLEVRRAITEDVSTLSTLTQVDFDGIILKTNQLSNQVDNLRLADNDSDEAPMDQDSSELSSSIGEWRQNLAKSWHNFMADFITVRRRDSNAEPLLAPNQDIYLRENIRSRLLVAAQAIPRHQNEVYKQSLETISTWVRAYFDTTDPATKAFLEELDTLSQQSITMDVPDQLKSQPLLEKLMQTRVRNLMAQSPAAHQEG